MILQDKMEIIEQKEWLLSWPSLSNDGYKMVNVFTNFNHLTDSLYITRSYYSDKLPRILLDQCSSAFQEKMHAAGT